jgi:hypothetical protein
MQIMGSAKMKSFTAVTSAAFDVHLRVVPLTKGPG